MLFCFSCISPSFWRLVLVMCLVLLLLLLDLCKMNERKYGYFCRHIERKLPVAMQHRNNHAFLLFFFQ